VMKPRHFFNLYSWQQPNHLNSEKQRQPETNILMNKKFYTDQLKKIERIKTEILILSVCHKRTVDMNFCWASETGALSENQI